MLCCDSCQGKAIVKRRRTAKLLCKKCFCEQFEEEIHETIINNNIFSPGDRVALGASGGKDSTVLIYVLKRLNQKYNYGIELFMLSIDEGLEGYRDDSLKTVETNSVDYNLPLTVLSYQNLFHTTMDAVVEKIGQKHNCSYCGVFRRQALEIGSMKIGANKIATGHNADDVAETVLMNVYRVKVMSRAAGYYRPCFEFNVSAHILHAGLTMTKVRNNETIIDVPQEYVLFEPPSDGISCLKFSPSSNDHLLVSSWDSTIRMYNVTTNQLTLSSYTTIPVLSCCFSDAYHIYTACLDGLVKTYELTTMKCTTLGCHEKAARCIASCSELNAIVSGSWDKTCKLWDGRLAQAPVVMQQQDKVYSMCVYDTKLMAVPTTKKDCASKYQVRYMEKFPNGDGFAYGTIEGRTYVETIDDDSPIDRYSFKCHRVISKSGLEYVHPVNAIAFHPKYNTFATGGSDGLVNLWDPYNKKRLCHLRRYPNSVVSLDYNPEGSHLAIASSYQFEENVKDLVPPDTIYIRKIKDSECKQRPA